MSKRPLPKNKPNTDLIHSNDISSSPYLQTSKYLSLLSPQNNNNNNYYNYNNNHSLYTDSEFPPISNSISGPPSNTPLKCYCRIISPLLFMSKGKNEYRAYNGCARRQCRFFKWAYTAERMPWYRFGRHNGYSIVVKKQQRRSRRIRGGTLGIVGEEDNNNNNNNVSDESNDYRADDLVQGRVGDCWFLSALAVIAQRSDLIKRLFPAGIEQGLEKGVVMVCLFLDGWWKGVIVDNYLPCIVDSTKTKVTTSARSINGDITLLSSNKTTPSSNPHAISPQNLSEITNTNSILLQKYGQTSGRTNPLYTLPPPSHFTPSITHLAYSHATQHQLWVPLLEKAYAKAHGCYGAISGGQIAEAFLDLTGCPTLSFSLLSSQQRVVGNFDGRSFWSRLMGFRRKGLPMGCGTRSGGGGQLREVGLVGHHAYSILDVREFIPSSDEAYAISIVNDDGGTGNVSGFGRDGIIRLLRIRNPHGQGEWNGDWSDNSEKWQSLLLRCSSDQSSPVTRSHINDGTFWIDYDNFLMAFAVVDVCLAFRNLHAKSLHAHFPPKDSPMRCTALYEVTIPDAVVDVETDEAFDGSSEDVEVYVMSIQKTRRGVKTGQTDKKKSYKPCDIGFLIWEEITSDNLKKKVTTVHGRMMGLTKNGHVRFLLRRNILKQQKNNIKTIVAPINFGHPAATDDERSFVVRFVASGPLAVTEKTVQQDRNDNIPLSMLIQRFCLETVQWSVIWDGAPSHRVFLCHNQTGAVAFVYLLVSDQVMATTAWRWSCRIIAHVKGMSCRTARGLECHEVVEKGKKMFEAALRRFTIDCKDEMASRLLMVLVQSGQTYELQNVTCELLATSASVDRSADDQGKQHSVTNDNITNENLAPLFQKSASPSDNSNNTKGVTRAKSKPKQKPIDKSGVFASMPSNAVNEQHLLSSPSNMMTQYNISNNQSSITDPTISQEMLDIERALALSREQITTTSTAPAASMIPSGIPTQEGVIDMATIIDQNQDDDDNEQLAKAIEMSLIDQCRSSSSNPMAKKRKCDVTMTKTPTASSQSNTDLSTKTLRIDNGDTIVIDLSSDDDIPNHNRQRQRPPPQRKVAPQKSRQDNPHVTIDLLSSDSDNDDEDNKSSPRDGMNNGSTKPSLKTSIQIHSAPAAIINDGLEDKRRKVREAAERRLRREV